MTKLLLLDIDRTLVHSLLTYLVKDEFKIHFNSIIYDEYTVFIRPHLETFLDYLKDISLKNKDFKIGLFTAGSKNYANFINKKLLTSLNIESKYIFSTKEYDEGFDFNGTGKSLHYISYLTNIPVQNIYLVDDSLSIKNGFLKHKELYNNCYNISKFVVCFDDTHCFIPESVTNNGLLECIEWIKNKQLLI